MKKIYPFVGYFKQGDDLAWHLEREKGDLAKALAGWSAALSETASNINKLAGILYESKVGDVNADCHHITIEVPEEVADRIVEHGLGDIEEDCPE